MFYKIFVIVLYTGKLNLFNIFFVGLILIMMMIMMMIIIMVVVIIIIVVGIVIIINIIDLP